MTSIALLVLGGACVDLDSLLVPADAGGGDDGLSGDGGAPGLDATIDHVSGDGPSSDAPGEAKSDGSQLEASAEAATDAAADTGGPVVPWWNSAYSSREEITITNAATTDLLAGFQVGWHVDVQALATKSGSFDEVRLVRWDTASSSWTELTRVIDDFGAGQQWIWVRLAATITAGSADGGYYLYFGNGSPPTAPNDPATVFDFYDAFSESTLGSSWQNMGGYTLTGSELGLSTNQHVHSTQTWGPGHAVDFVLRDPVYAGRYWAGLQLANTFNDDPPWAVWIARNQPSPATIWPELTLDNVTLWAGAAQALGTAATMYGVDWLGDMALYREADAVLFSHAPTSPYSTPLCARLTNESADTVYFSDLRVRQAVYPTPTVATGPVEH
jgi:hypothetical protein